MNSIVAAMHCEVYCLDMEEHGLHFDFNQCIYVFFHQ